MNTREIIISNKAKFRIGRHIAFWIFFSLHFIIQNLMIGGRGEAKTSRTFLSSAFHYLYFLPIYLLATYLLIEVLLPKLLFKKRTATFVFSFLLLFVLSFIAVYYAGILSLRHATGKSFNHVTIADNTYHILVDGLFVPFMLFGIAAGIKFSKKWILQQRENEKLAKQKLETELQLLKTSIHPKFLFHSLHTVEKHIERSSLESPSLILQLSDLLSYILYENDKKWVELEKELQIIRGYINLEEKSFDGRLLLTTEFPKNTNAVFISPCILLSFVQSSFEYFQETKQLEPLFKLKIAVAENTLNYQMIFSKRAKEEQLFEKFNNVRKQLLNQYGSLHQLKVSSENDKGSIELRLPLYSGELINLKINSVLNEAAVLV